MSLEPKSHFLGGTIPALYLLHFRTDMKERKKLLPIRLGITLECA